MSATRLWCVGLQDLRELRGRPLLWIWVLIVGLVAYGLSHGALSISSGDAAVGGTKAWITSEFAVGQAFTMLGLLLYAFFVSVLAGMSLIRDDELKVGELLHATPLLPGEYVWGKYLAVCLGSLGVLAVHVLLTMLFYQLVPVDNADEIRGPFALAHYVRPALAFVVPLILGVAGAAFWVGARTRRPILVFLLPVVLLLGAALFLWHWSPTWLDPRINRLLMLVEPAGFRWLNESWLKVDRGVAFYNHAPIHLDLGFAVSRLLIAAVGLLCVAAAQRRVTATLRGARVHASAALPVPPVPRRWPHPLAKAARRRVAATAPAARATHGAAPAGDDEAAAAEPALRTLRMQRRATGLWNGLASVARFELKELAHSPGLYLFVPIILIQILGTSLLALGAFDTPLLITSGVAAARSMNTITLLVCLLLLFYTVESLQREWSTGLASIYHSTSVPTAAILFGKAVANTLVGLVIVLATFVGCAIAILIQGKVGLSLWPFLLLWGVVLTPTFLVWSAFCSAVFAIARNRYTTYAVALGTLTLTGYLQATGRMSWAGNWNLWNVLLWSDLGPLQLDRTALLENRVAAVALSVLFTAITVRAFPRRDADPTRIVHRTAPAALLRAALRLSPYAVVPLVAIIVLGVQVRRGFQGAVVKKQQHDYWKQNLATYKDAPLPALRFVDLDLALQPARRHFDVTGTYHLYNQRDEPLRSIPFTGGTHWENVQWTVDAATFKPEDRSRLYVFTPTAPLQPGDSLAIGFSFSGSLPRGISKNGGPLQEFILPSGIVLTSFGPSFAPVLGYDEQIGVEERKNRYETRVYPEDFYKEVLEPAIGSHIPLRTRIRITGPAEYRFNSVGTLTHQEEHDGQRSVVWESDHPVRFFNVVGGRWAEQDGIGTKLFFHPAHRYNITEMSEALEAARRWYSEWFAPFPWQELKLSEFPGLSFYAQGFPTNITFSEGIGFLTKSEPKTNLAFLVTAHEAAHQWWGNLLTPGKGPGGDILSEGMSHYSTILLMEQVKGVRNRIEFCKRIEERYGDRRQADSERPLVKIDGSRPGDETTTYDKGGWVMWMLTQLMGKDAMLAGLREFMTEYQNGPDFPALQDLTATLRRHAPDPAAFDAFVQQWFFGVVVPQYRILEARRQAVGPAATVAADSAGSGGSAQWQVTASVENIGTGTMPVQFAAVRGERFPQAAADAAAGATETAGGDRAGQREPYREERVTVTLPPGERTEITLRCAFEPQELLVDPDALVLQLKRKSARIRF